MGRKTRIAIGTLAIVQVAILASVFYLVKVSDIVPAGMAARFETQATRLQELGRQLESLGVSVGRVATELDAFRDEQVASQMAATVERITAGKQTEQGKVIALAEWVAGNVRNVSQFHDIGFGKDLESWYSHRFGLCGARARLLERMCDMVGVHARYFAIYNLGGPGGGHAAVQAHYQGQWHYFDPTYAGYFERDGTVLSWEQILADPEAAVRDIVAFPVTSDRYTPGDGQGALGWTPVNNERRMRQIYTVETIAGGRSAGFHLYPDPVTLFVTVTADSLRKAPLVLGAIDNASTDVNAAGISQKLSEHLGSLGTIVDFLYHSYTVAGTRAGEAFRLTMVPWKLANAPAGSLRVVASGCAVRAGQRYGGSGPWRVEAVAESTGCEVRFEHDYEQLGLGMHVDRIELEALTR